MIAQNALAFEIMNNFVCPDHTKIQVLRLYTSPPFIFTTSLSHFFIAADCPKNGRTHLEFAAGLEFNANE